MFNHDTVEFAQEIIADSQRHDARTVGELVFFMQKYRLRFGAADSRPEDVKLYHTLLAQLRQQEALGLKIAARAPDAMPREEALARLRHHIAVFDEGHAGQWEGSDPLWPGFVAGRRPPVYEGAAHPSCWPTG